MWCSPSFLLQGRTGHSLSRGTFCQRGFLDIGVGTFSEVWGGGASRAVKSVVFHYSHAKTAHLYKTFRHSFCFIPCAYVAEHPVSVPFCRTNFFWEAPPMVGKRDDCVNLWWIPIRDIFSWYFYVRVFLGTYALSLLTVFVLHFLCSCIVYLYIQRHPQNQSSY